ncbi:Uncharacterized membrane protein [Desulfacinum hydrothermale DSM 13146]|uniref:Uncharacterized membrane protein n=1 Tax=Desulfacinum hydrothermale DSM 13146 TaxID=1121390 RepID=A0A1W1WZ27_9BACT|nr:DUF1269 domain-containing protein [Desulfacinum hydrothermale]SMC16698.1 Uncharacterized membrane protein [Desulfacinum hydrothermale DSM 13146]
MTDLAKRFHEELGIRISACYEALLQHHNSHLSSDPLTEPGWIPGLGNADFAIGTTQTFRSLFPDFPHHWIVVGYGGKKLMEKIGEEIDVYIALDVNDDSVHRVDSLGKQSPEAPHFRQWLAHQLARALWERTHRTHLFVLGARSEKAIQDVRERLVALHRQKALELESLVVLRRGDSGELKIEHVQHVGIREAAAGGVAGFLLGALFLHPLLGAAIGTVAGAAVGEEAFPLSHVGLEDDFIRELACTVLPGTWALLVVAQHLKVDLLGRDLKQVGVTVLTTSLSRRGEERLRQVLEGEGDG